MRGGQGRVVEEGEGRRGEEGSVDRREEVARSTGEVRRAGGARRAW